MTKARRSRANGLPAVRLAAVDGMRVPGVSPRHRPAPVARPRHLLEEEHLPDEILAQQVPLMPDDALRFLRDLTRADLRLVERELALRQG